MPFAQHAGGLLLESAHASYEYANMVEEDGGRLVLCVRGVA